MTAAAEASLAAVAGPALIGVSGGRDSVALLHMLSARGVSGLVVCHLDHGLRGESLEESEFVTALAGRLGCDVVCEEEDVAAWARRRKQSLETAAREARYEFFARVGRERGCPRLLLAHHADDQVETFLFKLFRGAGSGGLGGMREKSTRVIGGMALEIIRPLLGVWREEIDAYVAQQRLTFHEDSSNADPRHTRNRLRHELLPMLEAIFGRDIRQSVWRAAALLGADDEFLSLQTPAPTAELRVEKLRDLPASLRGRLLHAWLKAGGIRDVGFVEVERVAALLSGESAKVNLPGDRHARRRAGELFLE